MGHRIGVFILAKDQRTVEAEAVRQVIELIESGKLPSSVTKYQLQNYADDAEKSRSFARLGKAIHKLALQDGMTELFYENLALNVRSLVLNKGMFRCHEPKQRAWHTTPCVCATASNRIFPEGA